MTALFLGGVLVIVTLGGYLVAVGSRPDRSADSERQRRGRALGALYLVAGVVPIATGLLLLLGTAFGGEGTGEPLDGSFAAGLWSDLDDDVWYAIGGWLLVGGLVVVVGAWAGRRDRPLARSILTFGLLLLGVPGLLVGVGVIYLLLVLTLPFWRHEPRPSSDP